MSQKTAENEGKRKFNQRMAVLIIIAIAFLLPILVQSRYIQQIIIYTAVVAYLAMCWNIVGGYCGQLSFCHAVYFGIGAYISTLCFLWWGLSPWIGMVLGAVFAAIIGFAMGYPLFRLRSHFYALATIAFLEIARLLALNAESITNGPRGLLAKGWGKNPLLYQFQGYVPFYYIILIMLLGVIILTYWMEKSKLGFYLRAIKEDEDAALSIGINQHRLKLIGVTISAFLTALGGTFYAQFMGYVEPDVVFGLGITVQFISAALVGGGGTVVGPVYGSFILVPLTEYLRGKLGGVYPGLHLFIYGLALGFIIYFLPQGIILGVKRAVRSIASKTA